MDIFRVRLNCIDHYQAVPTKYDPQLRNDVRVSQLGKEPRIPVIRVFGSTETGQKVCAHIHGSLPYIYVEYNGNLNPDDVGAYIYRLHLSIDHALAVSYRRSAYSENAKFVARITLCKGVPFYGFHVGYRFYLKIYMLNPLVMTRLAELLQQGVIMKRKFQPYEAHLQYLLQFMTDYNLYGCAYIEARKACFRAPIPMHQENDISPHHWNSQSVSAAFVTDDPSLPRVSHCSIEVDICVQDILNRHEIKERQLHHDFIERIHGPPANMKLVHSMAGLWKDETRRRKSLLRNPASGSSPFPPEALISMSADSRDPKPRGWIHEDEYRNQIQDLIREESRLGDDDVEISFETFVERNPLESEVNTLLQAVEDLYPENLITALGLSKQQSTNTEPIRSSIEVDEQGILAIDVDDHLLFPDDSDEEVIRTSASKSVSMVQIRTPVTGSSTEANKAPIKKTLVNRLDNRADGLRVSLCTVSSTGIQSQSPPLASRNGIRHSLLRSGNLDKVPVLDELIAAAKQHGLVSKMPQDLLTLVREAAIKRLTPSGLEDPSSKRRRVMFTTDLGVENFDKAQDQSLPSLAMDVRAPSPSASQRALSQRSKAKLKTDGKKGSSNHILQFPVVKDPNDPSTRLRLSQQASSQGSEESHLKKVVSISSSDVVNQHHVLRSPETHDPSPGGCSEGDMRKTSIDIGCVPRPNAQFFVFPFAPPSAADVTGTMQDEHLPDVIYQDAYYSNDNDVPQRMREYAGQEYRLLGNTVPYLPEFDGTGSPASFGARTDLFASRSAHEYYFLAKRRECSLRSWEIAQPSPPFVEVQRWWQKEQDSHVSNNLIHSHSIVRDLELRPYLSQIEGATPKRKHGFKFSQKKKSTSVQFEAQYMSTMSLELHVNTRGKLVPNPEEDEVQCIFWCSKSDETFATSDSASSFVMSGIIVLSEDGYLADKMRKQTLIEVMEEGSELDLLVRMVEIVRTHDPDILTGYEVHGSSWGYLIERARIKYDYNLCDEFSRMKSQSFGRFGKEVDKWGFNTTSTIRVTGRHMINIWRAMRGELNLLQYTLENVTWHLLHRRIPHYSWRTLSDWYQSAKPRDLSKLLRYYTTRTKLDIDILEANELIPRTSEQARLLGVDFFSVFSRGSQFKVESIMFRIAKPENFMLVSPDRKQVGGQNALECLPLVMEPRSAFYNSPLLVLDFQSLYPSVMIAYNYCYSTFLGRIVNWRGGNKMGFTEYKRQNRLLELLKNHINIAPNGIMYCKPEVRKSLLAKMLTEILETRVMVKSGMKQDKEDKTLQQLLNNRQLALKLLANVTYGYTSASFSGRMPCSEIADSIVQTARETLERAIALIHSVKKWKAEVVYGDTDSLFVYLPGRTKDQAFDVGNEIAQTITDMNPRPVKLKFEKVYHPCVLLAKKRYVGYKYESRDQVKPEFDAKGIETVRRDGTPAEQMIEEKALKILFETADLSHVKAYFQKQCEKIMRGEVSIQDFCFAREVKLGTYSDKGPPPPGALISTKRMLEDARAEPQYGERVPYVVVTGAPGARLIDRCVAPEDLLANSHLQLDAEYYIMKNIIPPLERIFNLVGANIRQWYDEMPKVQRIHRIDHGDRTLTKKTLESYMKAAACLVCGTKTKNEGAICSGCLVSKPSSILSLQAQLSREERKLLDVIKICQSCAGLAPLDDVACDSKDCPVFYTRMKQVARYRSDKRAIEPAIWQLIEEANRTDLEW
ncbi:hypothetical protein BX600DRAFT_382546 [Xylariales sp. PMI_506]|nr:hypothetical protein BX600DRAFT_382546 [Xylariales sp. PMI_506]